MVGALRMRPSTPRRQIAKSALLVEIAKTLLAVAQSFFWPRSRSSDRGDALQRRCAEGVEMTGLGGHGPRVEHGEQSREPCRRHRARASPSNSRPRAERGRFACGKRFFTPRGKVAQFAYASPSHTECRPGRTRSCLEFADRPKRPGFERDCSRPQNSEMAANGTSRAAARWRTKSLKNSSPVLLGAVPSTTMRRMSRSSWAVLARRRLSICGPGVPASSVSGRCVPARTGTLGHGKSYRGLRRVLRGILDQSNG